MASSYERTFAVSVPVERAWRAFTDPEELEAWFTTGFEADAEEGAPGVQAEAASPGGPVHFEVTQIKDQEVLCYRQWAASPDTGIDVTVVFEPTEGGTRITVTHAGFGGDSILTSDSVRNGMDEAFADLVLYLEHGVAYPRHRDLPGDATVGADLKATGAGVEIGDITPGEFADDAGLRPGDLLLQLAGVPVFGVSDVMFFLREHAVGEEVDATWARGGAVVRGTGRLTPREADVFARRV